MINHFSIFFHIFPMEFGDFTASICSFRRLVASCEEVWGPLSDSCGAPVE